MEVDNTIEALKKLKEILDMGIITQKEFDKKKKELLSEKTFSKREKERKKISKKKLKIISQAFSIISIILFITGAIFLLFSKGYEDSFIIEAFTGEVVGLLAIIFGFVYMIFILIQLILNFMKHEVNNIMIIFGIIGVLFAGAAIPFGFISMSDAFSLLFSILMSVSCLFLVLQLIIVLFIVVLKKKEILV